ncbi:MAG: hypothetical protein JWN04_566 [Myxococcaceae bacterium]|nr:hypothetical protein [Myxococcaceae bacterium]
MLRPLHLVTLAALASLSCEGPTLDVGQRLVLSSDAGEELDAGESRFDASRDARVRDGNQGERDAHLDERVPCDDDHECSLFLFHQHCSPTRRFCVECTDDRHCALSGQCLPDNTCRSVDHSHDGMPGSSAP